MTCSSGCHNHTYPFTGVTQNLLHDNGKGVQSCRGEVEGVNEVDILLHHREAVHGSVEGLIGVQ